MVGVLPSGGAKTLAVMCIAKSWGGTLPGAKEPELEPELTKEVAVLKGREAGADEPPPPQPGAKRDEAGTTRRTTPP